MLMQKVATKVYAIYVLCHKRNRARIFEFLSALLNLSSQRRLVQRVIFTDYQSFAKAENKAMQ